MDKADLLDDVKAMGASRSEIAATICASPLAPERELSPSALGMWFTRGRVPFMWRPAVMERLGRISANDEAAA